MVNPVDAVPVDMAVKDPVPAVQASTLDTGDPQQSCPAGLGGLSGRRTGPKSSTAAAARAKSGDGLTVQIVDLKEEPPAAPEDDFEDQGDSDIDDDADARCMCVMPSWLSFWDE